MAFFARTSIEKGLDVSTEPPAHGYSPSAAEYPLAQAGERQGGGIDTLITYAQSETYRRDLEAIGHGVPSTWSRSSDESLAAHKNSLRTGVSLFDNLYAAALAAESLIQLGEKINLPAGIVVEHDSGGRPAPKIELPEKLSDMATDARVGNYVDWFNSAAPKMKADIAELRKVESNPYLNLANVDVALTPNVVSGQKVSRRAILDEQGNLLRIEDQRNQAAPPLRVANSPPPGRSEQSQGIEIDTLKKRFTARRVDEQNPDSDVLVDVHVQAQKGRIGYDLFNQDVGKPMIIEQRRYSADALVEYYGRLVPARSLPSLEFRDKLLLYGGKAFDIALDGSMIALGVCRLSKLSILQKAASTMPGKSLLSRAAVTAPSMAAAMPAATDAAAAITPGALGIAASHAALETVVGAGGIIGNNKWGETNASWINASRGAYFTVTCLGGLSRKFSSTINGGEALQAKMQHTGSSGLNKASRLAEGTMMATMPWQVGQIMYHTGNTLYDNWSVRHYAPDLSPARLAIAAAESLPDRIEPSNSASKLKKS